MNQLWQLEVAYTAQCARCLQREEVIKSTEGEAIAAITGLGWMVNAAGPWCPECKTLLWVRRGRKHNLSVGDEVQEETTRTLLGPILQIGDGYAEVKMSDGYPSVYALCELVKVK